MRDVTPNSESEDPLEFIMEMQRYLPPIFCELVSVLPRGVLEMSLDELDRSVRPSQSEKAFKLMFWDMIRKCEREGRQMTDAEARCGFISARGLERFTDNSAHLFWLVSPEIPLDVRNRVKLMDVMKHLDILTKYSAKDGDVPEDINYKYLDYQMKLYAALDKRVHGDFTQKIEEKSMRINYSSSGGGMPSALGNSVEDKIKSLQDRIERAGTLGGNVVAIDGKKKD